MQGVVQTSMEQNYSADRVEIYNVLGEAFRTAPVSGVAVIQVTRVRTKPQQAILKLIAWDMDRMNDEISLPLWVSTPVIYLWVPNPRSLPRCRFPKPTNGSAAVEGTLTHVPCGYPCSMNSGRQRDAETRQGRHATSRGLPCRCRAQQRGAIH